jgi:hypothetical protein
MPLKPLNQRIKRAKRQGVAPALKDSDVGDVPARTSNHAHARWTSQPFAPARGLEQADGEVEVHRLLVDENIRMQIEADIKSERANGSIEPQPHARHASKASQVH